MIQAPHKAEGTVVLQNVDNFYLVTVHKEQLPPHYAKEFATYREAKLAFNSLIKWKVTLTNNTDFPHGKEFNSMGEISKFVASYYGHDCTGDKYMEKWTVEGDYPLDIFDILTLDESRGNYWKRI